MMAEENNNRQNLPETNLKKARLSLSNKALLSGVENEIGTLQKKLERIMVISKDESSSSVRFAVTPEIKDYDDAHIPPVNLSELEKLKSHLIALKNVVPVMTNKFFSLCDHSSVRAALEKETVLMTEHFLQNLSKLNTEEMEVLEEINASLDALNLCLVLIDKKMSDDSLDDDGIFIETQQLINRMKEDVESKVVKIRNLESQLAEKEKEIYQIKDKLIEIEDERTFLRKSLDEKEKHLLEQNNHIKIISTQVSSISNMHKEREDQMSAFQQERDALLAEKDKEISKLNNHYETLMITLQEKDAHINSLQNQIAAISQETISIEVPGPKKDSLEQHLTHLEELVQQKDSALWQSQHEIHSGQQMIEHLRATIRHKDMAISEKDAEIKQLRDELESLKSK